VRFKKVFVRVECTAPGRGQSYVDRELNINDYI